ncbi:penicillin-binding transpeptidase domain-containing protein [Saccharothrix coeruleofusca]|uniref:Penicillin-binding protein n=1 Tax=Saccharothrix coeruleofusca TaxID=33919 RepID=A0A918AU28_9PSEU|nr:penicillin-binding transpeptidase domain-containing protein [Saccharothrix coeruleofusca]GGP84686.1 penicillin-binding protein [Saccharothrix coeruleofusca]
MREKTKRWVLACGALATVSIVGAGVALVWPDSGATAPTRSAVKPPGSVASEFVSAIATGDAAGAAGLTDAAQAAAEAITRTRAGMAQSRFHARLGQVPPIADGANEVALDADVTWTLPGGAPLEYRTKVVLRLAGEQWKVRWTPAVLHPALGEGQSLAYTSTPGDGALLDRDGNPVPPGFAPVVMNSVTTAAGDLTGTPGWQVAAVDAAGTPVTVLQEQKAQVGRTVTVTLDPAKQRAAQAAVDQVGEQAVVVALQPSTGEVLAVAQNAAASGQGPIALTNYFEPGSTFKVVTAAAAISGGTANADTPVDCPGKATIGTRQITNEDQFALGTVPLHRAFAASCNTSFSKLAADLPADALPRAAAMFGLTADYRIAGITTNTGKVPPAESIPERVENGIGQGVVQTTPFGMALLAATVAKGSTPVPRLIREIETTGGATSALPGGVATALRSMMGEVVTSGTARQLARFGGVRGKTGTAQFGDGSGAHGWFVGYQVDLAFAVLVVNGGSSKAAVAVTANFLSGF